MQTNDLIPKVTAARLNENMFKKFGTKINFDKYTREDLENYRNLLRTKIHQAEGSSNFNDLLTHETYQKDKYMVGVLNAKIKEMLGESSLAERKLTGAEKKKREEIVKAIKRDNPDKRTGKGKSSAYAIATAQAKKTAEGTTMKTTEGKKIDQNKDGKNDWEDIKIARMKASGAIPKDKKVKEETGKFDKTATTWTDKSGKKHPAQRVTRKTDQLAQGSEDTPPAKKKVKEGLPMTTVNGKKVPKFAADGKGAHDIRKNKKIKESTSIFRRHVAIVNESLAQLLSEDEEGKAKAITAASDMVNDFTTWMQRVGQYQTKSMIELADAIRAEFGQAESDAFKQAVAPALADTLETMTQQREAISHAVAVLAGEASDATPMGGETPDMTGGADEFDGEELPADTSDEFGASDAASGGAETAGREMRESREQRIARRIAESHDLMRILSK